MQVLQLTKFYPPVMGGIETVAWELTEGLARAGASVAVLCSHHRSVTLEEVSPSGYTVTRSGSWGMLQSTSISPVMPRLLSRLARGSNIVHLHMPDPMAAAAYWLVRPQGRLVVHWHSDVIRQRLALKLYHPLQSWVLRRADAIIATSPPYAASSVPLSPFRDKVHVIPIGISDNLPGESCSQKALAIRKRFGGRRLVWALGRMTYYKGYEVLIDAAASLPGDCAVLIGGDGELLEHYRRMVNARGLSHKVFLLGQVPDEDVASHFEACDIFCMPSTVRSEAYGVAMVEAMVMGKPVVATDIEGSGVPWVNRDGETGVNVPAGDSSALAQVLITLLRSPSRRNAMGRAARKRYETEFHARTMTERTLDLYRRLAPA